MMVEFDSPEARKFLSGLDEWVQVHETVFPHQELTALVDWLNERSDQVAKFASGWGLDTKMNCVYIDMIRYTNEEIAHFRDEVIDSPMISLRDPRSWSGMESDNNISLPLIINPELENLVSMTVTEVAATTVTIAIHNKSVLPLITGYGHTLEYYDVDEWRFIPSVFSVNSVALPVNPGESFEMAVSLEEYLHLISPGLFRIRKEVMIDTWQIDEMIDGKQNKIPIDTLHEVAAEFSWS